MDRRGGRRLPVPLVLAALAVLASGLVARFLTAGCGGESEVGTGAAGTGTGPQALVAALQQRLRADPDQPHLLTRLGVGYLTLARQTADPSYYTKASQALERSRALAPDAPETMTATGLLEAGRHNFESALEWGSRAAQADPGDPDALGVVADAQVELGRYEEAAATVQRMVDLRPNLASLARVSYLRELNGDTSGAAAAMAQAATAGAGADAAAAQSALGNLHLAAGRLDAAGTAYRKALLIQPEHAPAEVGLARV
ncbi:MAG TPA: tetratricopeptide repeat protein, partial [Actinomycetota bacterium]